MIIGLTGRNGAGKGTVAEWLQARGLRYTSLSDELRADLRRRGLQPTRDNLIAGGRRLREEGGPGVLAQLVLQRIADEADGGPGTIVDSVRNPAEVEVLRTHAEFRLLEVRAERRTRYERIRARNRAGDAASFEEFVRQEEAELNSSDVAAQRLVATAAMADLVIDNDDAPEALEAALSALFPELAGE